MTKRADYAIPFLREMMETLDYKIGVKRKGKDRYTAQTYEDVLALYDLCVKSDPDLVVDVGTSWGASCVALALAMKTLGKPLKYLTTIGYHQKWWPKIVKIHRKLLRRYDLPVEKIKKIAADFSKLEPRDYIPADAKVLIFYDIHDERKSKSTVSSRLLNVWIPRIEKGVVAVHDMTPVPDDWNIKDSRHNNATMGTYWKGGTFTGFAECGPIIEYLNSKKAKMTVVGKEIIWFSVKKGKPVQVRKPRAKKPVVKKEIKDDNVVHDLQTVPGKEVLSDTGRRDRELDAPSSPARDNDNGEGSGSS